MRYLAPPALAWLAAWALSLVEGVRLFPQSKIQVVSCDSCRSGSSPAGSSSRGALCRHPVLDSLSQTDNHASWQRVLPPLGRLLLLLLLLFFLLLLLLLIIIPPLLSSWGTQRMPLPPWFPPFYIRNSRVSTTSVNAMSWPSDSIVGV